MKRERRKRNGRKEKRDGEGETDDSAYDSMSPNLPIIIA